jgi:hypothetical protein
MVAPFIRKALGVGFVLAISMGLFAQVRPAAGAPLARDLNSTLAELTRVAPATIQDLDLAGQQQPGGKLHWVKFWGGDKLHDADVVEALRRNLQFAVPNLVRDAQVSGGNISTTFKLYNDLTAVCHSLGSLLPPGSENKSELSALSNDLADMNRLREELSSHIQRAALAYESRNPTLFTSTSLNGKPVKRIVDDTVSDSPSPKKRRASN